MTDGSNQYYIINKMRLMKLVAKHILSIGFFLGFSSVALSQAGWNWGDSIDIAKEKNALYTDALTAGNLPDAEKNLSWLLKNTPDLNEAIYKNGAKIYEGLATKETDPEKAESYKSKAMEMYDKRIEYYGGEENVINRKATSAYKLYKKDRKKYGETYNILKKAFELNGSNMFSTNLVYYMDMTYRYKVSGGDITDESILDTYFKILDALKDQESQGKSVEKLFAPIEQMMLKSVDLNCELIQNTLGEKLKESKNYEDARKVLGLLKTQGCLVNETGLLAYEIVNEKTPDFGISKLMALEVYDKGNGDIDKTLEFFEDAIAAADENEKKSEVHLTIAKIHSSQGNKVSARSSARRALSFDPSNKDAYKHIGDLYMTSFNDCKKEVSQVVDRAVFFAAYEMYQKAGNGEYMTKAKEQFPTIDDIFNGGYKEGDNIQVDCWINQSVTIERRPTN